MFLNKLSEKQFLSAAGAKTHLSDDEDYQHDSTRLERRTVRNNYYAQKRILDHEIQSHHLVVENFEKTLKEETRAKFEKQMRDIRARDIRSRIKNIDKTAKSSELHRLKSHSVETDRDCDYYYSGNYMSLLRSNKAVVCYRQLAFQTIYAIYRSK